MSKLRFDVVQNAFKKKAVDIDKQSTRPYEYFGELVFKRSKMKQYIDGRFVKRMVNSGEGLCNAPCCYRDLSVRVGSLIKRVYCGCVIAGL